MKFAHLKRKAFKAFTKEILSNLGAIEGWCDQCVRVLSSLLTGAKLNPSIHVYREPVMPTKSVRLLLPSSGGVCCRRAYSLLVLTRAWQFMICGGQKALISGLYPVDICDIQLLDSVETWMFSAIFQVFYLVPLLSIDIWMISWHIQQIFFDILLKYVWFELNFSQISLDVSIIYLWYPPDILVILRSGVKISRKV